MKANTRIAAACMFICLGMCATGAARAQEPAATGSQNPSASGQSTSGQNTSGQNVSGESARGQNAGGSRPSEVRVALTEAAVANDASGREALAGRLRTATLKGTIEAPERNSRIVLENRSAFFYNYATGWATFYDEAGVRCGEGLWKLEALAPGEAAEVDTPGLRLTCAPATWRIVATNLITRTSDVAKPVDLQTSPPPAPETVAPETGTTPAATAPASVTQPLEININGRTLPLQLGRPVDITVGKERVLIVVTVAP